MRVALVALAAMGVSPHAAAAEKFDALTIAAAGTFPSHTLTKGQQAPGTPSTEQLDIRVELRGKLLALTMGGERFETKFDGTAAESTAPARCQDQLTNSKRRVQSRAYSAGGLIVVVRNIETAYSDGACRGTQATNVTLGFKIDVEKGICRFGYTWHSKITGAGPSDKWVTIVDQPCEATVPGRPSPKVAAAPTAPIQAAPAQPAQPAPPGQPAQPAQQDWNDCAGQDAARVAPACSRIIDDQKAAPHDRADAYLYRGGASLARGDLDRAIADYGEAIKLAPQNVIAYASRALAYARKGDRAHAIADYYRADGIDSAKLAEMSAGNAELKEIAAAAAQK